MKSPYIKEFEKIIKGSENKFVSVRMPKDNSSLLLSYDKENGFKSKSK